MEGSFPHEPSGEFDRIDRMGWEMDGMGWRDLTQRLQRRGTAAACAQRLRRAREVAVI